VTPTNLSYNVFCIPSGVYRYAKERRMVWPLAIAMTLGTLPGVFLGAIIRVRYLPDPTSFKIFAGAVLLYLGIRLLLDVIRGKGSQKPPEGAAVTGSSLEMRKLSYEFAGEDFSLSTPVLMAMSFAVGIVGGAYGIGGGAILVPFLVVMFKLPVHTIGGAALFSTWVSSVIGVIFYTYAGPFFSSTAAPVKPDLLLGLMLGIGGFIGIYIGARLQKYMPVRFIKAVLALCLLFVGLKYTVLVF